MLNLMTDKDLPDGFHYPAEYLRTVRQGLTDLTPWHLLSREAAQSRLKGLAERYPTRRLIPFARRQDNDDVACWDGSLGYAVVVVHDFSSPGHEQRRTHADFWEWFRAAVEDMIGFDA